MNSFAKSRLLAKGELERAWPSYVLSGSFVLLLGLFAMVSHSGVFELDGFGAGGQRMEEHFNAFFADYLFLLVCAFLGVNVISGVYTPIWRDTCSSRLVLLKSLPVPAESLVGSRALCMVFALVLGVPAFFLPALYLTDLGELGTTPSYLPFAGVWIGYSLLASGLWLILELTVSGKVYTLISIGFGASLMAGVALLEWILDLSLVERTAQLAQEGYGALLAIFSVLAGGAAFALLFRAAVRRLGQRDL
jgi:hypothetical protein